MPKLIREARFGPPKCFKTGSVVGTYPKPMLVLSLDSEGLSVIPAKGAVVPSTHSKMNIDAGDIVYIKPIDFPTWQQKPLADLPKVLCIDFPGNEPRQLTDSLTPPADGNSFPLFVKTCNLLLKGPCPWKTVVNDGLTGLSKILVGFIAQQNPGLLGDARKWAPAIGEKIAQMNAEFCKLPCHYVVLMHESTDKNELTSAVTTEPMIYSKYRETIGGDFSAFFHQRKDSMGNPVIDTTDTMYIKGIGARWPANLPKECKPTFDAIYGDSVRTGEVGV